MSGALTAEAKVPVEERLLRYREIELNGCWRWTACLNKGGYGRIRYRGVGWITHRLAYVIWVGDIPDGLELDHLCRNRACFNPQHLEPVTRSENVRRGLGPQINSARGRARTHCPQGHPYDEENTGSQGPNGAWRTCRACGREAMRRRRQQARAEREA